MKLSLSLVGGLSRGVVTPIRPLSTSVPKMDPTYRIEADTFGELKVRRGSSQEPRHMTVICHLSFGCHCEDVRCSMFTVTPVTAIIR